jgi:maleylpyruvate isomerase
VDAEQRDVALAGARAAHRRLLATIDGLTDDQARSASRLPGWTIGHVLTHIARNGDSFVRMMSAAIGGQAVTQYEAGRDGRAADIEAGAGRRAAALVTDVSESAQRLELTWDAMTAEAWGGHGVNAGGETWPCEAMPFHRWREVEVHHVDLGLGYGVPDWPDDYVERELAITLRLLPERLDDAGQRRMLGWLLGRSEQPALDVAPWQFRADHYMR